MFKRFTADSRAVVEAAQVEARALRHRRIGTEHLLLGLAGDPASPVAGLLDPPGLDELRLRVARAVDDPDADDAALRSIGIDPTRVREAVEATFGRGALERQATSGFSRWRGHVPFSPRAKKVLELSLREALRLGDRHIGPEHIMLGILRDGGGVGAVILAGLGVDRTAVEGLRAQLPGRA